MFALRNIYFWFERTFNILRNFIEAIPAKNFGREKFTENVHKINNILRVAIFDFTSV